MMDRNSKTLSPKAQHRAPDSSPLKRTSRGRSVANEQSVTKATAAGEEQAFLRAIIAGLADLEAGRELPLAEAKARLRLT